MKMKHNNLVAKSAYVPTNTSSKKKKKTRNDRIILSTNWSSNPANRIGCDSRSLDFNVKIGSNDTEFPKNMSKFGKGLINSSGSWTEDQEHGLHLSESTRHTIKQHEEIQWEIKLILSFSE